MLYTLSNKLYKEKYSRTSSITKEYIENMKVFLSAKYPNTSIEEIEEFIKKTIKESYKPRKVAYLFTESPGNVDKKKNDLLSMTNELNNEIITPYGSTFVPTSEDESFFVEHITSRQNERKIVKKEMLLAEANKDKVAAMIGNLKQMNIKIDINAISGIMLANVFFGSAVSYNSITASARHNIMLGYSYTEMALMGNMHLYSENQAINWVVNLLRIYPGDTTIQLATEKFSLMLPSHEDVFEFLFDNIKIYDKFSKNESLKELINTLSIYQLAFIFYACNLHNIFTKNDHFKNFFDRCFDTDIVFSQINESDPYESVFKLNDSALFILTTAILCDEITGVTLDKIDTERPDLGRKIKSLYNHLQDTLSELNDLIGTFMLIPIVPSDITNHQNMIRKTTILSDTDSIIFTNVSWVRWYTNDIRVNKKSYAINALMVCLTSKILEHVFAYSSACMNIAESGIKDIEIKNEFMFDVFIRTSMAKHYAGYIKFREGNVLNPYKFELKGKNFIGSDLCDDTRKFVKEFIRYIMDTILTDYELSSSDLISRVIGFEQKIITSILNGDTSYLIQSPLKHEGDYANPDASPYFYYLLWRDVFSSKYGVINLPQKCKVIPIEDITIKNIHRLEFMKDIDINIYNSLIEFIKKYSKKKITRIFVPMGIPIPMEVRQLANMNKVVSMNCAPLYLMMSSVGIVNSSQGDKLVSFSDEYKKHLEITDYHERNNVNVR